MDPRFMLLKYTQTEKVTYFEEYCTYTISNESSSEHTKFVKFIDDSIKLGMSRNLL